MTEFPLADIMSLDGLNMGCVDHSVVLAPANLGVQAALHIARNSEMEIDSAVWDYLEDQVDALWSRIQTHPESYIMDKDEFALFNYFVWRFKDSTLTERAVARFWKNHHRHDSAST